MSISAIKIKQKELGLSDERYREILRRIGNVTSSKDLTPYGDRAVYRELCRMARAETRSARYLWVLWDHLQPHLSSSERKGAWLCGFLRKIGIRIDDLSCLDNLSASDLHKAIEAVKKRLDYEDKKESEVPF